MKAFLPYTKVVKAVKLKLHVLKGIFNSYTFSIYLIGMASPLVGIGAVNALLFAAYSRLKSIQTTSPNERLALYKIAIAGAGAGMKFCCSTIITFFPITQAYKIC